MFESKKELVNFIISTIIICSLFTTIFYLLFHFFVYFFLIKSDNYISSGIGAFMGAFAAFLFLIFEKIFSKYRERRVKHLNAVVRAQYLLNENLQYISDNIFLLKGFERIVKKGGFHIGGYNLLQWDRKILLDLANLEIINRLGEYATDVNKFNRDIQTLEAWYEEMKGAYLQGHINSVTFEANMPLILSKIEEIRQFLLKIDDETLVRESETRVLLKNKNILDWFFDKLMEDELPRNFDKLVKSERAELEKEIKSVIKKSKEELKGSKRKK